MIDKVLHLLKKGIPTGIAIKGISSSHPKLKNFILSATTAGYGSDAIIDFLRSVGGDTGKKEVQERAAQRKAQGRARPDELADLAEKTTADTAQRLATTGIGLAAGGIGLAAGGLPAGIAAAEAITGAAEPDQRVAEEPEREESFFQRAMQGEDFFSLPTGTKASVGKLMQRLNILEKSGKPWKDRSVQNLVRGIRKLVRGVGLVERETARFERGAPQAPTSSDAEQQLLSMLDSISKEFLS